MKMATEKLINTPEVSIIVPVYKVEKYIDQCLESIKRQTFSNWECIMVNDGSPDKAGQICERFLNSDPRFKLIHKENGGLSSARNEGLAISQGRFIAFVDSDDWIDTKYIETLYNLLVQYDADIAQCGFIKEFKTFKRKKRLKFSNPILEGEEVAKQLLIYNRLPGFMWNKLFRKELINSEFPVGLVYEDYYVMTSWVDNIKKVVLSPEMLYHYRMRKGSITASSEAKYQLDFMNAVKQRVDKIKKIFPDIFSADDEKLFIYRNLLERAKIISRREKDPIKKKRAVQLIQTELEKISIPDKEIIGKKLWKRASILAKEPDLFIKRMSIAGLLDLHDRFCSTQLYD